MNHKQQALMAEYLPNKAFTWWGPSVCRLLSTTFKEPTNLGLCAVELPDPPDGYQFCDNLEEADMVYSTYGNRCGELVFIWCSKGCLCSYDLIFAYAKKKPETREEYLKRTMPEGYEWLGRGISTTLIARFPNGFIGRAAWHDDWDVRDSTLRGSDDNLYYCCKKETREEYLKRTVPEGYEWLGRGTLDKLSAPEFTGRSISVDDTVNDWADTVEARYCGTRSSLYYIRKIEQPRPKFDPQVGSKWKHYQSEDTFVLERLHNRKFVLLDSNGFRWTAPMHCAKDAFGGREAEFEEYKD